MYKQQPELRVAHDILRMLGTRKSLLLAKWLERGSFDKLVNLPFNPLLDCEDDYLAINLLKKYPFDHINLQPEHTAKVAWIKAEVKCAEVNRMLNVNKHVDGLLYTASQIIAEVLEGNESVPTPPSVEEWRSLCKFGSKAAVGNHGVNAHLCAHVNKLSYWEGHPWLPAIYSRWNGGCAKGATLTPVAGSLYSFVPKNAKTHRSICIEPVMEMYFQQGLGRMIKRRLRKVGINLSDQRNNQKLAYEGSKTLAYATIDLSAASDSIAYGLVARILPPLWMKMIDMCRVGVAYSPDGEPWYLEKVSSMGNGFTFPLQTLIFYGIARAAMHLNNHKGKVRVYGDDIIVPTVAYDEVCNALSKLGFTVNPDKSYHQGTFRESCGMYARAGSIIRPVRLTEKCNSTAHWIRIANAITAQAFEEGGRVFLHERWRDVYRKVVRYAGKTLLPKAKVLKTPTVPLVQPDRGSLFGLPIFDSALLDPRGPLTRDRNGWDGYWVETIKWTRGEAYWQFKKRLSVAQKWFIGPRSYPASPVDGSRQPRGRGYLGRVSGQEALRLATYLLSVRFDGGEENSALQGWNPEAESNLARGVGINTSIEAYSTVAVFRPQVCAVFVPAGVLYRDVSWGG